VIPLSSGKALVEKAQALRGRPDLMICPGAGRGFDFHTERTDAQDAMDRALSSLQGALRD